MKSNPIQQTGVLNKRDVQMNFYVPLYTLDRVR